MGVSPGVTLWAVHLGSGCARSRPHSSCAVMQSSKPRRGRAPARLPLPIVIDGASLWPGADGGRDCPLLRGGVRGRVAQGGERRPCGSRGVEGRQSTIAPAMLPAGQISIRSTLLTPVAWLPLLTNHQTTNRSVGRSGATIDHRPGSLRRHDERPSPLSCRVSVSGWRERPGRHHAWVFRRLLPTLLVSLTQ